MSSTNSVELTARYRAGVGQNVETAEAGGGGSGQEDSSSGQKLDSCF